jgi:hypothetical protein
MPSIGSVGDGMTGDCSMSEDDENKPDPAADLSDKSNEPADPAPDPGDGPRACKDPWTWRKGAEWKKGQAANLSGVNGASYRNKAAAAAANLFDGEAEHLSRRLSSWL